jgi:hypothetical protein
MDMDFVIVKYFIRFGNRWILTPSKNRYLNAIKLQQTRLL